MDEIIRDFELLRFGVVSYTLLGLVMRCRIQSFPQIGWEWADIKTFEVVEIFIFEVVGLVEIWCRIIYFVRIWTKLVKNWLRFKHLKWSNYKCRHEREKKKKKIGNAVADLQPVLGLTWLGLGFSLTDKVSNHRTIEYSNRNRTRMLGVHS